MRSHTSCFVEGIKLLQIINEKKKKICANDKNNKLKNKKGINKASHRLHNSSIADQEF